jgi:Helix-turn-helix domain
MGITKLPVIDGVRITNEVLRAAYDSGASIRELEAKTGQSYGWVHHHLLLAGTDMRGRGTGALKRSQNLARARAGVR